ncbi:hypothetical protein KSS87_003656 [Heliosperma pusillum]|nr:hypothetical protein KSS87_003656 [Heliosperma pusillum]
MQNEVNNAIVSMDTDISTVSVLDISTVSVAENTIPTSGRKVYQIPEPYILTRWTKKSYRPIVYDENGKVIEDFDEVDVRKIEMSNVWSEIYKTVGLLDSGELKNMKEFSKLLKQFRETVVGAVEKKSKNKEIEDLLGCKAPQEIDILPPHKAKNKGSGKRQMSSKEKAVRKTEKRKRRCGNCKRWVNHNSRTCNLPFVEDLPSDDDERETDDEESFSKRKKKNRRPKYRYFTFLCIRMSSITDNNQISPLEEALDKANKKIESLSIEILEALTNVEAAEAREEYMQKELDSLEAQIKFLKAEKDGMRRQLEEKQYTEADMDGQFVAGVKALKKSYTRVNTSIPDNWSAVHEAMELMHA